MKLFCNHSWESPFLPQCESSPLLAVPQRPALCILKETPLAQNTTKSFYHALKTFKYILIEKNNISTSLCLTNYAKGKYKKLLNPKHHFFSNPFVLSSRLPVQNWGAICKHSFLSLFSHRQLHIRLRLSYLETYQIQMSYCSVRLIFTYELQSKGANHKKRRENQKTRK